MNRHSPYIGRFAPSPTGPLHLGSLVAAMASYLDAKTHFGRWLVRIEDLDRERNVEGADRALLAALQRCGMHWDGEVLWQSARLAHYETALHKLQAHIYPCACSRKEIADSRIKAHAASTAVYPGTCRHGLPEGKTARALRLRVPDGSDGLIQFEDRWQGLFRQELGTQVGDFVIRRADGVIAYQLAVVVDDGAQGVTDIVRGADLLDSTARQIHLQALLNLPQPRYLHVPVVTNAAGEKLSKQTGALPFDAGGSASEQALLQTALLPAARFLGLDLDAGQIPQFWQRALPAWDALLRRRGAA